MIFKKNDKAMKQIIEDIKGERFTTREYVAYGILAPAALFAACILSEIIIK